MKLILKFHTLYIYIYYLHYNNIVLIIVIRINISNICCRISVILKKYQRPATNKSALLLYKFKNVNLKMYDSINLSRLCFKNF